MNLSKLFDIQTKLDERIVQEHNLQGQDILDKKILALQVELGELANEWRGFKFWSKDQEPRREEIEYKDCGNCKGTGYNIKYDVWTNEGCEYCEGKGDFLVAKHNPLLEEYVDCLHFILSIGLELGFEKLNHNTAAIEGMKRKDITSQFNYLFDKVGDFSSITNHNNYMYIVPLFIGVGEMLGFTWEQIYNAYLDKNQINHERQTNGY